MQKDADFDAMMAANSRHLGPRTTEPHPAVEIPLQFKVTCLVCTEALDSLHEITCGTAKNDILPINHCKCKEHREFAEAQGAPEFIDVTSNQQPRAQPPTSALARALGGNRPPPPKRPKLADSKLFWTPDSHNIFNQVRIGE